jgi:hypothetical protein
MILVEWQSKGVVIINKHNYFTGKYNISFTELLTYHFIIAMINEWTKSILYDFNLYLFFLQGK